MAERVELDPPPSQDHPNISPWVDEQIWGHRLWDAQTPWLLFLEFLSVAEACNRQGRLLHETGKYYPLVFHPYKRMYLRNILFNNAELSRLREQRYVDQNVTWQMWISAMNENARGVHERDFSYLKGQFPSFTDFVALIEMLRGSTVESERDRRWTSRFVFPFGPKALYVDVNIGANNQPSPEYINFGRTGELLYLMLCRSTCGSQLIEPITKLLLGDNPWNKLLGLLQPESEDLDTFTRGQSYLPYRYHSIFDKLGEDWLSIFNLGLLGFDSVSHLVILGAFHALLYQITIAAEKLRRERKPHMICEVVAPQKTLVRELSFVNYQDNVALPAQAVEAYIDAIEHSEEWQEALREPGAYAQCCAILKKHVWWPRKPDDYDGPDDPDQLMRELRAEALKGHRQHVAHIHRAYGREVGLVSKRGTNKLRYAPNDTLLKTLIAANVQARMELGEFLDRLYQRYGLVFGEREAEQVLVDDDFDKKAFQANAERLERRLSSLGMLRRLSDSCAYVENPYRRRNS